MLCDVVFLLTVLISHPGRYLLTHRYDLKRCLRLEGAFLALRCVMVYVEGPECLLLKNSCNKQPPSTPVIHLRAGQNCATRALISINIMPKCQEMSTSKSAKKILRIKERFINIHLTLFFSIAELVR